MKMATIPEVVRTLGVGRSRIVRAIEKGELRVLKLGNRMLVDLDDASELVKRWDDSGIGIDALSTETGLSVGAIRAAVKEGWLPFHKSGKAFRFDLDEVNRAIELRIAEQLSE